MFRKIEKKRADAWLAGMEAQFRELDARYLRLEQALDRLSAKFPQVMIEQVHIHRPVLEKLEFRMDSLDIENLSGSLNLGNNFGAKLVSERQQGAAVRRESADSVPEAAGQRRASAGSRAEADGLQRTPTGYRFQTGR